MFQAGLTGLLTLHSDIYVPTGMLRSQVTFTSIGLAILSFIAFLWYCWSRKLIFQGRWSLSMP